MKESGDPLQKKVSRNFLLISNCFPVTLPPKVSIKVYVSALALAKEEKLNFAKGY